MPLDLIRDRWGVADSAARNMVARWRRAGWVDTGQRGDDPPVMWVWATAEGIGTFGRYPYAVAPTSAARVAHHRGVIQTRIALEHRLAAAGPWWTSERELRYQAGGAVREHMPDGLLEVDGPEGGRVAYVIEVELTPKPVDRVRRIMATLLSEQQYRRAIVLYVTAGRTTPLVTRARDELAAQNPEAAQRIRIESGVLE